MTSFGAQKSRGGLRYTAAHARLLRRSPSPTLPTAAPRRRSRPSPRRAPTTRKPAVWCFRVLFCVEAPGIENVPGQPRSTEQDRNGSTATDAASAAAPDSASKRQGKAPEHEPAVLAPSNAPLRELVRACLGQQWQGADRVAPVSEALRIEPTRACTGGHSSAGAARGLGSSVLVQRSLSCFD